MFARILIANRGEIACRVMRTARRLGIATVAVHSDADAGALHVGAADEAVAIGPAPARDSYLRGDAIIAAAKRSGAEAIHPGYGFLSENADFAEACAAAGLVFIGPSPRSIRAMGGKSQAKALMEKAGVPVVPGYHGTAQEIAVFAEQARRIGYPVLVKASAGGGGKGMRIVRDEAQLAPALDGARREALAAFGDDRVLIERYLEQPRHIEVQVFGDRHGNCVHLFERDCSLQRRHQKVVEEAPAPGLTDARRRMIGEAAVRAARAVDYEGAGTIEFIVDRDGSFYFMEMNTRLQVEHPVTEMITGLDLVEWQLRVAAGEALPLEQAALHPRGHAFEARLYAEDPDKEFLPSTGRLARLDFPAASRHVRVDTGVREGDAITVHYDPMIAKLVVWDVDRAAALRRLARALGETRIAGPATNLDFLRRVAAHGAFASGEVDTGFIARHRASLIPEPAACADDVLALAVLGLLARRADESRIAAAAAADRWSPWNGTRSWRLGGDGEDVVVLRDSLVAHRVDVRADRDLATFSLTIDGRPSAAVLCDAPRGTVDVVIEGRRRRAAVTVLGADVVVDIGGVAHRLAVVDPLASVALDEDAAGHLAAPMPGRIVAVHVAAGDAVARGQALVVLEAMKMEHTIAAPSAGRIERVAFAVGDQVDEGAILVDLAAETPASPRGA
ncbi:MAG: acetyl/propionyl/methylcrotonyl-CoA carboxylase subunit alpha [Alphaproteobacteria bacterium]|nr:acetyl/propionyl/methylcrotonyl-CoA carboxylase subunit alpha [Alphaproteobacteria bacterium]